MITSRKEKRGVSVILACFLYSAASMIFFIPQAWSQCTSCDNCPPPTISYSSKQVAVNTWQDLTASGGFGAYHWSCNSDNGNCIASLSSNEGEIVRYTAPSSNPNCVNNPVITLSDSCGKEVRAALAVNNYPSEDALAYVICTGAPDHPLNTCRYYYNCRGELCHTCGYRTIPNAVCGCDQTEACAHTGGPPCGSMIEDSRAPFVKAEGCCVSSLLPCLATINFPFSNMQINTTGDGGIITAVISYESGTSGNWTLSIEGTGRTFQGSGTNVSEYWDGKNSDGKLVEPGKYKAQLTVQGTGSSCQIGTETKTATIEVTENSCENQEPGTCKPVFSLTVPADPPSR